MLPAGGCLFMTVASSDCPATSDPAFGFEAHAYRQAATRSARRCGRVPAEVMQAQALLDLRDQIYRHVEAIALELFAFDRLELLAGFVELPGGHGLLPRLEDDGVLIGRMSLVHPRK